jgi:hypothetical protein
VTTAEQPAVAERVAIDGYPMDELRGSPPGTLLPSTLLDTSVSCRVGRVDGEQAAVALRYTAHGIENLCLGATLPAARRAWRVSSARLGSRGRRSAHARGRLHQ